MKGKVMNYSIHKNYLPKDFNFSTFIYTFAILVVGLLLSCNTKASECTTRQELSLLALPLVLGKN